MELDYVCEYIIFKSIVTIKLSKFHQQWIRTRINPINNLSLLKFNVRSKML